jgi:hypothetical protein
MGNGQTGYGCQLIKLTLFLIGIFGKELEFRGRNLRAIQIRTQKWEL